MKVRCQTIDDFLVNLGSQPQVFENVVYVNRNRRPLNNLDTAFEVTLQASAVVRTKGEEEYLLEVGVICGKDYPDASQDYAGTERADELKDQVAKYCAAHGLTVRPGIVSE